MLYGEGNWSFKRHKVVKEEILAGVPFLRVVTCIVELLVSCSRSRFFVVYRQNFGSLHEVPNVKGIPANVGSYNNTLH